MTILFPSTEPTSAAQAYEQSVSTMAKSGGRHFLSSSEVSSIPTNTLEGGSGAGSIFFRDGIAFRAELNSDPPSVKSETFHWQFIPDMAGGFCIIHGSFRASGRFDPTEVA